MFFDLNQFLRTASRQAARKSVIVMVGASQHPGLGAMGANKHADVARRIMNEDFSDSVLIDVSRLRVREVLAVAGESGLGRALDRILASDHDDAYSSFTASI
jgi:hypothetical protein